MSNLVTINAAAILAANVSSFSNKLTKSLSLKFNKPSLAVSYSPLYFLEKVDSKLLPNILQSTRFNEGSNREPIKITEKQLEEALQRCIAKGYLEKDENIDFNFLNSSSVKSFPLTHDP